MPFFDHFWWLRAIGALLLAVGAAGLLWLAIPFLHDNLATVFTWSGFMVAVIVLFLVGTALTLAVETRHAYDRTTRRRTAIEGNQEAMPRSRINVPSASTPGLATALLVVEWPIGRLERPLIAHLRIWVGMAGLVLWSAGLSLIFTPLLYAVVYKVVLALAAVCSPQTRALRRTLVQTYGSPRRTTLNAEGILWEPILGRSRLIRWYDARLLEVSSYKARAGWTGAEVTHRRYTLYSQHTMIWWTDPGTLYGSPSGDFAALLAAIGARAGLVPRTFAPELKVDDRIRGNEPANEFVVRTVPPETDPDAVYELVLLRPAATARSRVIVGVLGAALCAACIAALLWALDQAHLVAAPAIVRQYTGWLNGVVAFFFIVFGGLLGAPMLIGASRHPRPARTFGVRADANGLSELHPQYPALMRRMSRPDTQRLPLIPWSAVTRIKSVRFPRGRRMYVVRADDSDQTIMWSGGGSGRIPITPESGARLITPEDLLALVAARSGKPVEIDR